MTEERIVYESHRKEPSRKRYRLEFFGKLSREWIEFRWFRTYFFAWLTSLAIREENEPVRIIDTRPDITDA